jgi:hypothetical protein
LIALYQSHALIINSVDIHDLSTYTMELPNAIPYAFHFRKDSTALVIIDMQRDFLEPGGFGSIQYGDTNVFNTVRKIVPVIQRALEAARNL